MLRRRLSSLAISAVASTCLALAAHAVPIAVSFSGTITEVPDPFGLLDPSIQVGSPFSGSYTVDPDGASFVPSGFPELAAYFLAAPAAFDVTVESILFSQPFDYVTVADGFNTTELGIVDNWGNGRLIPGTPFDQILTFVSFNDTTATKLGSTALFVNQELTGWDVAEFQISRVQVFSTTPGDFARTLLAKGTISVVPEPATGILFSLGLAAMAAWRHGASRRST